MPTFTKTAASALIASLLARASAIAVDTPPNILVVLFDDVGFTGSGPYGSDARACHRCAGAVWHNFLTVLLIALLRAEPRHADDGHGQSPDGHGNVGGNGHARAAGAFGVLHGLGR